MSYHIVNDEKENKYYVTLIRNGAYERLTVNDKLGFSSLKEVIVELCNNPILFFYNDYYHWRNINYKFKEKITLNNISKDYIIENFPEFFVF